MDLSVFFSEYYEPLRLRGKSAGTSKMYRSLISVLARHLGRAPTIEGDFTELAVCKFLVHRAAAGRAAATIERERSQLVSMWKFALDRNLHSGIRPCISGRSLPERIPICWTIAEMKALVAACEHCEGSRGAVPASLFFRGLILALWCTAERIGAIMASHSDDYSSSTLLVHAEQRKGSRRDKLYSLSPPAADAIERIIAIRPGLIFAWDRADAKLWDDFGQIVARAGLRGGRAAKFHALRRAAATHFAAAGGDPVALLDHSNPRTTKRYIDPRLIPRGPQPCDVLPDLS